MTRAMGAAMRRIQAGNALSAFGLGFTVPYLYVYVAQVRDLGAGTAGVVLAVFAMAALLVLPFTGRAIDRRGPLPVLVGAARAGRGRRARHGLRRERARRRGVRRAAGRRDRRDAARAGHDDRLVLDARHPVPAPSRSQFFLQNLGLGVGGLIGGQIVDESRTRQRSPCCSPSRRRCSWCWRGGRHGPRMPRPAALADARAEGEPGRGGGLPGAARRTGRWCSCACSGS